MFKSRFLNKDIISTNDFSKQEIIHILDCAKFMEKNKKSLLHGKVLATLFFEPSTRTRLSFEIAAKRMSADTFNISASTSSVVKGETLLDTARNIEAMNPDIIIMRHPHSGAAAFLAARLSTSIINAGDGCRAHPTQALLDAFTIQEKLEKADFRNTGI